MRTSAPYLASPVVYEGDAKAGAVAMRQGTHGDAVQGNVLDLCALARRVLVAQPVAGQIELQSSTHYFDEKNEPIEGDCTSHNAILMCVHMMMCVPDPRCIHDAHRTGCSVQLNTFRYAGIAAYRAQNT